MKLGIFGATGKTGLLLVAQALEQGHDVVAVVRSPEKLAAFSGRIKVVTAQLTDGPVIAAAIADCDAVLLALGTVDRKPNTVLSEGTRRIIDAMREAGCRRLVAITSLGCGDSLAKVKPWLFRELIVKRLAKEIWADKDRQEAIIQSSNLDYTILRPGGLADEQGAPAYQLLEQSVDVPKSPRLKRSDLAEQLLNMVADTGTVGKIYTIVGAEITS
ncbi:MAG: NAD(P)H-binding protein [Pseudomonadota bacterium]